ncbi:MAG: class I SAM-dependent methyltransferase [Actinomycetota bacterium]|nr:class I SAM-dependent methyltransferase [Actinomycetota bacterium]
MDEPRATPAVPELRAYWERRLDADYGLGGVGYIGLGEGFNRWGYRARRRVFLRTMRQFVAPGARVLDLGSGTGFYLERWRELRAGSIVGSDITEVAVTRLAERHPHVEMTRFDAGDKMLPWEEESFDAISAMDVLFHIVDDERFRRALHNAGRLLRPGGVLVFSDLFVHGLPWRVSHQAIRSLDDITSAVEQAGLEVELRRPMLVLLNSPVDTRSRLLRAGWAALRGAARRGEALGTAVGAAVYPFEVALAALLREGPSAEIMVCRRPERP